MTDDIDKILHRADFSAGSDHKEKLRQMLFHPSSGVELTDDELGLVAGGVKMEGKLDSYT